MYSNEGSKTYQSRQRGGRDGAVTGKRQRMAAARLEETMGWREANGSSVTGGDDGLERSEYLVKQQERVAEMAHSHGQKTANGSTRPGTTPSAAGERDWRRRWAGGEASLWLCSNTELSNLKPHL